MVVPKMGERPMAVARPGETVRRRTGARLWEDGFGGRGSAGSAGIADRVVAEVGGPGSVEEPGGREKSQENERRESDRPRNAGSGDRETKDATEDRGRRDKGLPRPKCAKRRKRRRRSATGGGQIFPRVRSVASFILRAQASAVFMAVI